MFRHGLSFVSVLLCASSGLAVVLHPRNGIQNLNPIARLIVLDNDNCRHNKHDIHSYRSIGRDDH